MKGILPALAWCLITSLGALACLAVTVFVLFEAWSSGSFDFILKATFPLIAALALFAGALANGATLRRRLYYARGGHKAQRRYHFELRSPILVSIGPIRANGPGLVQLHIAKDAFMEVMRRETPSFEVRIVGLSKNDLPPAFSELVDGGDFSIYSLSPDFCRIDIPIICKTHWEAAIELSWSENIPHHALTRAVDGDCQPLRMDVILSGRFTGISLPDDLLIIPNPKVPIRGFEVVFPKNAEPGSGPNR